MAKQAAISTKQPQKVPFFARLNKHFKDTGSELKKVSWPTKKELVRMTGIVLIFIAIFAVVVGAMDYGLLNLMQLITGAVGGQAS